MRYRKGYKYQLHEDEIFNIPVTLIAGFETEYFSMSKEGILTVKSSYAWDGPTWPAIDTKNFMKGSLVHDCLYQIMREGFLAASVHRKMADILLIRTTRAEGMSRIRCMWVYYAVRIFGVKLADPANRKQVMEC